MAFLAVIASVGRFFFGGESVGGRSVAQIHGDAKGDVSGAGWMQGQFGPVVQEGAMVVPVRLWRSEDKPDLPSFFSHGFHIVVQDAHGDQHGGVVHSPFADVVQQAVGGLGTHPALVLFGGRIVDAKHRFMSIDFFPELACQQPGRAAHHCTAVMQGFGGLQRIGWQASGQQLLQVLQVSCIGHDALAACRQAHFEVRRFRLLAFQRTLQHASIHVHSSSRARAHAVQLRHAKLERRQHRVLVPAWAVADASHARVHREVERGVVERTAVHVRCDAAAVEAALHVADGRGITRHDMRTSDASQLHVFLPWSMERNHPMEKETCKRGEGHGHWKEDMPWIGVFAHRTRHEEKRNTRPRLHKKNKSNRHQMTCKGA